MWRVTSGAFLQRGVWPGARRGPLWDAGGLLCGLSSLLRHFLFLPDDGDVPHWREVQSGLQSTHTQRVSVKCYTWAFFPHFSTNMLQWVTRRYTYRLLEVNNVVHQSINQSIAICRSLPNLGLKVKYRMFVQTTLHFTKVRIYDVNSRDHKEKTVNEKACPNFSMVVFVYFIHIILSIYTIHNTYISV